jgi:hypothetical protein
MKITTYKSLLTGKKTMVVASIGKCGHAGYREVQVVCEGAHFHWRITDGYNWLKSGFHVSSLKSALNIAEGYCKQV